MILFSPHSHLSCKWWQFVIHIKLYHAICKRKISGDNSFIPWQGGNRAKATNTVNWGNLLVTIFAAPSQDKWHLTLMYYPFKTLHHRNAIPKPAAPYFANIAPYQLATGTIPGPNGTNDRPVSCAGNTNYHNCRAVSLNDKLCVVLKNVYTN
jgi:hypothetical protein